MFAICAILSYGVHGQSGQYNISVTSAQGEDVTSFLSMQMVGEGVHLYNVQHNGGANAISYDNIGTFHSNRFPGLSMDSGMVLTTGDVNVAAKGEDIPQSHHQHVIYRRYGSEKTGPLR